MITPSDRDYKTTKRIKQGKNRLSGPLAELAQWVSQKWNVCVLNVRYERRNSLHAPRIQVVVEHESEARKFYRGVNFDKKKQEAVANKLGEIIGANAKSDFEVDGLFVIFSAFAPIARQEADSQIPHEDIDALSAIKISDGLAIEISPSRPPGRCRPGFPRRNRAGRGGSGRLPAAIRHVCCRGRCQSSPQDDRFSGVADPLAHGSRRPKRAANKRPGVV